MNSNARETSARSSQIDYRDPIVAHKFEAAVKTHQAGNIDDAELAYREVLKLAVDHPGALNLLGALHQQKGEYEAAVKFLTKAIEIAPENPDFYSNLGAAYFSLDEHAKAEECIQKALLYDPDKAILNANMAGVLIEQKRLEAAYQFGLKAFEAEPSNFKYGKRLGDICRQIDRFGEAVDYFGACVSIDPKDAEVTNSLGYSYERLGDPENAEKYYRRALELRPDSPEICNNLAGVLRYLGREEEAQKYYDISINAPAESWSDAVRMGITYLNAGDIPRALTIFETIKDTHPDDAELWSAYAVALSVSGDLEAADAVFQKAIELESDSAFIWNNFATNTGRRGDLEESAEQFKKAIEISPTYADPYINLCLTLMFLGRLDEAYLYAHMTLNMPFMREGSFGNPVKIFRGLCDYDALEEIGDLFDLAEEFRNVDVFSNFLSLLPVCSTPEQVRRLADLHMYWGEHLAIPEGTDKTLPSRPPKRGTSKLRIGFLSSDLKSHSVSNFVLPILKHYDRNDFEIYCFSPVEAPDDKKQTYIKGLVDNFHIFENVGFRAAAEVIREQNVDVLFELNGFTKDTMINSAAYKPAPLQIYWLGYPFTTGMPEMDRILVDQYFAPEDKSWLAEEPLYMPESWVAFDSFFDVEIADKLPVELNGKLTFGTLNAPYKFTRESIAVWATIMKEFEDSQFLLVRPEADSKVLQTMLRGHFEQCGVEPERIQFVNNRRYSHSHLAYYNLIDISLDSFPQTGGTTTCDAIWMGVPVISLVGPSMHQRVSYSLLENAGCGELACFSLEEYMGKAVMLGNDITSLREYRHNMRPALLNSPLCQGERFTENFQKVIVDAYEKSGA